MCPEPTAATSRPGRLARCQGGFALVSAIFLLVILASLGAMMLTFSTVQHAGSAQDVQGSRAYRAAKAGIEWGLYQVLQNGSCTNTNLAPGGSLNGFAVSVVCATAGPYTEAGQELNVHTITATATSGVIAKPDYVERQLQVRVERRLP